MLLGKRPRGHPIKRTTSMTEFTLELNSTATAAEPSNPFTNPFAAVAGAGGSTVKDGGLEHRLLAPSLSLSPRNLRRNSADFLEPPHFLRSCALCKRRLVPGRDIYMYRGDSAFCSAECREQQMEQDERKEKCSLAAAKKEAASAAKSKSQVSA